MTRATKRRDARAAAKLRKHHEGQQGYWRSRTRFNVCHSGRRSGKSDIAKARLVKRAVDGIDGFEDARFVYAAPVFRQVKAIAWDELKRLVPKQARRGKPSETTLTIPLWHGGELFCVGMDAPERLEGAPLDHIVLDEYGNMKAKVWPEHVRPALSTLGRPGTADFIGVPEGRNHYYDLAQSAKANSMLPHPEWAVHHWPSWEILDPEEIASARRDLDTLTFDQEYGGEFILRGGRAYYCFGTYSTAPLRDRYRPEAPLILCFDFNVEPGVAAVAQELTLPVEGDPTGTAVIGEVHIRTNSTTPAVCRKLLADWADHKGPVHCYGDATGGARGSAQTEGSDWDLIRTILANGSDGVSGFGGERLSFAYGPDNPTERARVNAVNSRLRSDAGLIRMMVDPVFAPYTVKDFEGVVVLDGTTGRGIPGEIDKKGNPLLSHLTDALGYYVEREFPTTDREWRQFRAVY